LREVFCLVLESREKNRTFEKVEGGNMDFFLNNVGVDATGLHDLEQKKKKRKNEKKKLDREEHTAPCFLIKRMQGLNLGLWTESELQ
jgi:hypothetical protein